MTSVKLPRIEIPTFDGNLLHWSKFWEQFDIAVHPKINLAEAEKLVYLQQALKGGSAKQAIEGPFKFWRSLYRSHIACLKDRYCHPRLIHSSTCSHDCGSTLTQRWYWEGDPKLTRPCATTLVSPQISRSRPTWSLYHFATRDQT